jgi:hypothetical protein
MNKKVKEWVIRYVPANIFTTLVVLFISWITIVLTNNGILAAFLASICGTISYYAFMLVRDVIISRHSYIQQNKKYNWLSFIKNARNIILEFGIGELLDTLLIGPFFLYIMPIILHNYALGIIVGKYLSDIFFYIPTIISYELRKKHLKD